MNPLAEELNEIIQKENIHIYEMLSMVGKDLYFPKGILTQSAEAKEKARKFNATIGMATEEGRTMYLPSVMSMLANFKPEEALTYAPSFGSLPLRTLWKEVLVEKNPSLAGRKISLPVVSQAITHGLSVVADMWIDPGDVIVLPDKNWGNYSLIFSVRRSARIAQYPLFHSNRGFNVDGLRRCLDEEGRKAGKLVVLLNFPNNPTGYTISPSEADSIASVLTDAARGGKNILAILDDAYFGLFFEENVMTESLFTRLLDRHERLFAIKLDAATKENFVWGLRVGFVTYGGCLAKGHDSVYNALERKTAGAVRGSISNASQLSQTIVFKSLQAQTYRSEREAKFQIMKDRALEVKRVLADPKYSKAWEYYPFNSGYFMCLQLKTVDAEPLRVHLLHRYGVGLISLGKRDLRVAFSCVEKRDIRELFDLILKGVVDLESGNVEKS
jgi:aspartate/methionine/tyrosine aminotransferase